MRMQSGFSCLQVFEVVFVQYLEGRSAGMPTTFTVFISPVKLENRLHAVWGTVVIILTNAQSEKRLTAFRNTVVLLFARVEHTIRSLVVLQREVVSADLRPVVFVKTAGVSWQEIGGVGSQRQECSMSLDVPPRH